MSNTGLQDRAASERWYVVHTQPHAEGRAVTHLEWQGYPVFCPRSRKIVRHARKSKTVLAPLFSTYLFLRLDILRDQWRSVNGTPGVVRLVMQGETPLPVPRGVVEAIRIQLGNNASVAGAPSLRVGQSVRIADGPFEGLVGVLQDLDAAGRVRLLLDLLGQSVSVALRDDILSPAA